MNKWVYVLSAVNDDIEWDVHAYDRSVHVVGGVAYCEDGAVFAEDALLRAGFEKVREDGTVPDFLGTYRAEPVMYPIIITTAANPHGLPPVDPAYQAQVSGSVVDAPTEEVVEEVVDAPNEPVEEVVEEPVADEVVEEEVAEVVSTNVETPVPTEEKQMAPKRRSRKV